MSNLIYLEFVLRQIALALYNLWQVNFRKFQLICKNLLFFVTSQIKKLMCSAGAKKKKKILEGANVFTGCTYDS